MKDIGCEGAEQVLSDTSYLFTQQTPETEFQHMLCTLTGVCLSSPFRDRWRFLKQPEGSGPVASQSSQHRREGDQWQQNHLQRPGGVLQGQITLKTQGFIFIEKTSPVCVLSAHWIWSNCSFRMLYLKTVTKSFISCLFQAYIKIYQGEELPHPKSMLQVHFHQCPL